MKNVRRVAVACIGDPRDWKTWSGAPRHLIDALGQQGIDIVGIDTGVASKWRKVANFAGYHFGRQDFHNLISVDRIGAQISLLNSEARSDYNFSKAAREGRALRLQQELCNADTNHLLHMTSLSLAPSVKPSAHLNNYVYCDTTWNIIASKHPIERFSQSTRRELEYLEAAAFDQVDHFFTMAEYVRQDLIDHYKIEPNRVTAVGTGRGKLLPFQGNKNYSNSYILFTAKLRFEEKGGRLLLDAFGLAHARNSKLKLVIVGQESYVQRLRGIPGVTARGHIAWNELQELFDGAALFAMPSLCEPWGLVYLEALASRTPVLGLNCNSLPEITQNGKFGFLVDDASPAAIAETLAKALDNPEALRIMGEAGQRHCLETYSWQRVASNMIEAMFPGARTREG